MSRKPAPIGRADHRARVAAVKSEVKSFGYQLLESLPTDTDPRVRTWFEKLAAGDQPANQKPRPKRRKK